MSEDKTFYVYQLRDPRFTEPFYIGKGKSTRAWEHITQARLYAAQKPVKDNNYHKHNIINKIERDGVQVNIELLLDGLTNDEALAWEIFFIGIYGRADEGKGPLTNWTDGGDGTVNQFWSDEARAAASVRNAGHNNPAYGRKGSSHPMFGVTPETVPTFAGMTHDEEARKKMRESLAKVKLQTCPHCLKSFRPHLIKRWHGDNCQLKKSNSVPASGD